MKIFFEKYREMKNIIEISHLQNLKQLYKQTIINCVYLSEFYLLIYNFYVFSSEFSLNYFSPTMTTPFGYNELRL